MLAVRAALRSNGLFDRVTVPLLWPYGGSSTRFYIIEKESARIEKDRNKPPRGFANFDDHPCDALYRTSFVLRFSFSPSPFLFLSSLLFSFSLAFFSVFYFFSSKIADARRREFRTPRSCLSSRRDRFSFDSFYFLIATE